MTIGERIKQRRIELGLTQAELAQRLGNKTRAAVCRVEKDKEDLTTERIKRYAEALECDPGYLIGRYDSLDAQEAYEKILAAYAQNERLKRYSTEEIIKALDFLDAYQKVPSETRAAIKLLLTAHRPES